MSKYFSDRLLATIELLRESQDTHDATQQRADSTLSSMASAITGLRKDLDQKRRQQAVQEQALVAERSRLRSENETEREMGSCSAFPVCFPCIFRGFFVGFASFSLVIWTERERMMQEAAIELAFERSKMLSEIEAQRTEMADQMAKTLQVMEEQMKLEAEQLIAAVNAERERERREGEAALVSNPHHPHLSPTIFT